MKTYHAYELFYGWRLTPSKQAVATLKEWIDTGRLIGHQVDDLGNVEYTFTDGQDECRHLAVCRERRQPTVANVCEAYFAGLAV
jgi:hypothetical protein